jgi:trimethylamine:corrinoid methyltransferase-like protein
MKWFKEEFFQPGRVIDRDNKEVWLQKGATTAEERAHQEVERILASHKPLPLPEKIDRELVRIMKREANRCGMEQLP